MSKPTVITRAKAALQAFMYGFPGGASVKSLPWPWPGWRQGQPQWHMFDFMTYVDEGFNMNSLVYSAIMYKVRAMITAPLKAYSGDPNYPERLSPRHALSKLVARPNEHQSWAEFHALNEVYLNVAGDSYVYKMYDKRELQPLRPDRVFIVPTKGSRASIAHYLYVPEGGSTLDGFPILPQDMIHVKLPNPGDPLEGMGYGLSPMSAAAHSIDIDNMVTSFLNRFFDQGSMLTGILTFDVPLRESVVDTILERWHKKYGGHTKWGVGVLDRGGKYQRIGLDFEEMAFDGQDERNETRILGPFGVPPILIGTRAGLARSTYSNYEGARKAVWEDTLVPELRLFEVEYQYHLGSRGAFVQFDLSQVPALQKDLPPIVNAAYTLWQMGVPSNQALAAVGLRIGEVPGGDVPHIATGTGQGQGSHSGVEEGWGMNALQCSICGGELKYVDDQEKTLTCSRCYQLYLPPSNGRDAILIGATLNG